MNFYQTPAFEQIKPLIESGPQVYSERFASQKACLIQAAKRLGLTAQTRSCGKYTDFKDKTGKQVGFIKGHANVSLNKKGVFRQLKDKYKLKLLWQQAGIPVPKGVVLQSAADLALLTAAGLTFPLVVKPLLGSGGRGITVGVQNRQALISAINAAQDAVNGAVLVEEQVTGLEVRCYMLNGSLIAASSRLNAYVIGDGTSSVAVLIEQKNRLRRQHPHLKRFLLQCPADIEAGLVLANGQYLQLQPVSNLHQGGESVNVTELIPASLKAQLQQACAVIPEAGAIGLDIILSSFAQGAPAFFIEGNSAANINVHLYPMYGQSIDVASQIIAAMMATSDPVAPPPQQAESDAVFNDTLAMIKHSGLYSSNICFYAITTEALRRGLKVSWLTQTGAGKAGIAINSATKLGNVYEISDQKNTLLFNKTRCVSLSADADRYRDKSALRSKIASRCAMPASCSFVYPTEMTVLDAFINKVGFPLVVKPVKGSMGKNVFVNIKNRQELEQVLSHFGKRRLLVEAHVTGDEYRVYSLANKVVALLKRLPAHVVGDGKSTLEQLLTCKNKQKAAKRLPKIALNAELELYLAQQNLTLLSVPAKGCTVQLSDKLGRSAGGDIVSCPLNEHLVVQQAMSSLLPELDFFGADVIVDKQGKLFLLEINIRPQISSALLPDAGPSVDIPALMLTHYFPEHSVIDSNRTLYNCKKLIAKLTRSTAEKLALDEAEPETVAASCNSLPVFTGGVAPVTDIVDANSYQKLGNINQVMLRRAAWLAGFSVDMFFNTQKKLRWTVSGNGKLLRFRENMPPQTSQATRKLTNDKQKTKQRLMEHGIAVPSGLLISSNKVELATSWFEQLSIKKAVVKPLDGSGGRGVTSAITSVTQLHQAIARCDTSKVMLEQHIDGADHRLLVVGGRLVAAIRREPACVVGDGQSSIEQLIQTKNSQRRLNPYTGKALLKLDAAVLQRLQRQGFNAASVPQKNLKVYLQSIANVGAGGDSFDITEQVHPDFIRLAQQCWHAFDNLAFCGIDLLADDITKPANRQGYAVIEINANCDVAMHHFPTAGQARDAAGTVIEYLFGQTDTVKQMQVQLVISGKVQRVGYRNWLRKQALLRGITGWVENKSDGSVCALLNGAATPVKDLLSCCGRGPETAVVNSVQYVVSSQQKPAGFLIKG